MATTLSYSSFLTCCRPIENSFCFLIETPKLINFYNYPFEYFLKFPLSECNYNHENLIDHSLNTYTTCTDDRSWSLDRRQNRQHFHDIICGRIPHCGPGEGCKKEKSERKEEKPKPTPSPKPVLEIKEPKKVLSEKDIKKEETVIKGEKPKIEPEKPDINTQQPDTIPDKPVDETERKKSTISDLIALCNPEDVILTPDISKEKLPSKEGVPSVKTQESVPAVKTQESVPYVKTQESVPAVKTQESVPYVKTQESVPSVKNQESVPYVKSHESVPYVKSHESVPSVKTQESVPYVKTQESVSSVKSGPKPIDDGEPESKDVVGLTDDLIEKLDRNLRNLEATFDKFVRKNRDFIQNLVGCLDFEKRKQKTLEDEYNKLKKENEDLKAQNDYLKMVNNKQLGLFKDELDKGITESKVIYKRKIHLMERQLQNDQNELQTYKQTEKKYMEVVEQDNEKIEKLNNKIDDLKTKEVQLVRNYLKLLKFLENVKDILSNADPKEIPQLRSLNTITDSGGENDPDVRRVLRDALSDGISTLNVRDLSILHDAIEELNGGLCHQADKCTKSPTADPSYPDFSNMNIRRLVVEHSYDDIPKSLESKDEW